MLHHRRFKDKVTVTFKKRDDGGLCAHCDAVPGFYLSGANPRDVMADVVPVMELLFKHNAGIDVEVFPLRSAVYLLSERPGAAPESDEPDVTDVRDYLVETKAA